MVFFEKHGVEEKEFFQTIELKNYDFPPHFHRAYEMIYINDGSITLSIDQREYQLQKDDLAFIFPNQIHEFKNINFSVITVILFSQELIGDFYLNYKGYIPVDNILHLEGRLDTEKLNTVYSQKSFLYSLCADLIRSKTFSPVKQSPQMTILYKILVYVEQNYTEECTLRSVAKYLQYDYPYLSKLFTNLMNITFTDYLNYYRIAQAGYLLRNTHKSIGEIASDCGYSNLRTFHRNFQKINGQSPKNYR